ncbi:MAG: hypothetical protein DRI99_01770 [Candidatus Aminicenantes bacterium]|nr:MAG: hypothetical protein DRI99_01770 [Candidatus Aminicenantes bacterium]
MNQISQAFVGIMSFWWWGKSLPFPWEEQNISSFLSQPNLKTLPLASLLSLRRRVSNKIRKRARVLMQLTKSFFLRRLDFT